MRDFHKVRTPHFPLYSEVQALVRIWDGVERSTLSGMMNEIAEQTGTPQRPVRWDNPDSWLKKRLSGDSLTLATRIWLESEKTVNPRHVYGTYLFINAYHLLEPNVFDCFQISAKGRVFLDNDPKILCELDEEEGLPRLLSILAGKNAAKRSDLLPEWSEYLREYSSFTAIATIQETLRRRLVNLMERGYVVREGLSYSITRKGIDYADHFNKGRVDRKRDVIRIITTYNQNRREELLTAISAMSSQRFESMVLDLFQAMGYEDITIVADSGGRGLEMTALASMGISTVKKVLLLSRKQTRVGRQELDRLRGLMANQDAVRGSLVTLGKFTRECREAAVLSGTIPVTLIDGEHLVELLIRQGLGVKEIPAHLLTVDEQYFADSNKAVFQR